MTLKKEGADLQIISLGKVIDFVGESTKSEDLKEDLDGNSNEIKLRETEKTGPLKFKTNIKENKIKEVQ